MPKLSGLSQLYISILPAENRGANRGDSRAAAPMVLRLPCCAIAKSTRMLLGCASVHAHDRAWLCKLENAPCMLCNRQEHPDDARLCQCA